MGCIEYYSSVINIIQNIITYIVKYMFIIVWYNWYYRAILLSVCEHTVSLKHIGFKYLFYY